MQQLIQILEEIEPDLDYRSCDNLVSGGILDSLSIISIVTELEDRYDITIPTVEIVPENFDSAERLWKLVCRLREDE